jgi:hypothetical protein
MIEGGIVIFLYPVKKMHFQRTKTKTPPDFVCSNRNNMFFLTLGEFEAGASHTRQGRNGQGKQFLNPVYL